MIVRVYWNFNKKCWSVQHKHKIIGYANSLLLKNVSFVVSQKGRQRVLKEKRKNVHAFAVGELIEFNKPKPFHLNYEIIYNPYKADYFFHVNEDLSLKEIKNSLLIYCWDGILFSKEK